MIKKDYIEVVYNETDVPFTSYPKKLTKYLSKKYNIQKKNNLLELGCGRGEFLKGFENWLLVYVLWLAEIKESFYCISCPLGKRM